MIINTIIVIALYTTILYFPIKALLKYNSDRKAEKRRQEIKKYYMQMYYSAPSLREAEYWLDKYNKGI